MSGITRVRAVSSVSVPMRTSCSRQLYLAIYAARAVTPIASSRQLSVDAARSVCTNVALFICLFHAVTNHGILGTPANILGDAHRPADVDIHGALDLSANLRFAVLAIKLRLGGKCVREKDRPKDKQTDRERQTDRWIRSLIGRPTGGQQSRHTRTWMVPW
jgi:hypothetical protein